MDVDIRVVDIDLLDPDPLNPQVQDLGTFNELVEAIRQDGMLESVNVVPEGDRFRIVAGEHRWKAAKLAGLKQVPVIVTPADQWSEDERRIALIRSNVIKGKFDPEKFSDLWRQLEARYGKEALLRRTGLDARQAELKRVLKETGDALPDAKMKAELAKRGERIRSVEDLSAIVNSLYAEYGATLDSNFVAFSFMGRTHLMVRCTPETFGHIRHLVEVATAVGEKADRALSDAAEKTLAEEPRYAQTEAVAAGTDA